MKILNYDCAPVSNHAFVVHCTSYNISIPHSDAGFQDKRGLTQF